MTVKELIDKLQTFHPDADVKATVSRELKDHRSLCLYGDVVDCDRPLDPDTEDTVVVIEIEVDPTVKTVSYFGSATP